MFARLGPVVCFKCGGPREVESRKPGEIKYKPCERCGAVGTRYRDDPYRALEIYRKIPKAK